MAARRSGGLPGGSNPREERRTPPTSPRNEEASDYSPRNVNLNLSTGQIILLMLVGGGLVVGLFWAIESLGPNKAFVRSLTKVLSAVVTVFTTYFLINRALRIREKESDTILVSFMGYIEYLVKTYSLSYGAGPTDDPALQHHLQNIRGMGWKKIEEYSSQLAVNTNSLPRFLLDAINWQSYLQTGQERMLDIHRASERIISFLGVCSPKMATVAMEVTDQYSDIFADDWPVIKRGLRGFEKLNRIVSYGGYVQDGQYHQELQEDIAEAIAAALEGLQYVFQKLPHAIDDEMSDSLKDFRANLHKRYHKAYDEELTDLGEKFDLD